MKMRITLNSGRVVEVDGDVTECREFIALETRETKKPALRKKCQRKAMKRRGRWSNAERQHLQRLSADPKNFTDKQIATRLHSVLGVSPYMRTAAAVNTEKWRVAHRTEK